MKLVEYLKSAWPRWRLMRLRLEGSKPPTDEELALQVKRGLAVAQTLAGPGWQVLEEEWSAEDKRMLEELAEPITHEQYLERRGAIRGFRSRVLLPNEVVGLGLQAEQELARRHPGGRSAQKNT